MSAINDAPPLSEICSEIRLGRRAQRLIDDRLGVVDYLGRLLEARQLLDAMRFLAFVMPPRDRAWWNCLCLWDLHEAGSGWSNEQHGAVDAVVRWVFEPSRRHWEALDGPAQSLGRDPVGFAARAARLSGWSPGPDKPIEPVDAARASGNAYCCVLKVASARDGTPKQDVYARLLHLGIDTLPKSPHWLRSGIVPA